MPVGDDRVITRPDRYPNEADQVVVLFNLGHLLLKNQQLIFNATENGQSKWQSITYKAVV
jgi:hypothetical protein